MASNAVSPITPLGQFGSTVCVCLQARRRSEMQAPGRMPLAEGWPGPGSGSDVYAGHRLSSGVVFTTSWVRFRWPRKRSSQPYSYLRPFTQASFAAGAIVPLSAVRPIRACCICRSTAGPMQLRIAEPGQLSKSMLHFRPFQSARAAVTQRPDSAATKKFVGCI